MTVFEIPTRPVPQRFTISLGGVVYDLVIRWNDTLYGGGLKNACWYVDVYDINDVPLALGLPLVTGADLLAQLKYLGIGGELIVQSDNSPDLVPDFDSLGSTGHLYFSSTGPSQQAPSAPAGFSAQPVSAGPTYRAVTTLAQAIVEFGDQIIGVDTAAIAAPVPFALPKAAYRSGVPLTFKDISGMAGTYNITLTCAAGETIDPPGGGGSPTVVMHVNDMSVKLLPVTGGWVRLG